jgi:uncharacterized protein YqgV (UPF0045/DUF77 family)
VAYVEFTIEPFVEGRPGPHVTAAIAAAEVRGLAVEVGPFGSSVVVDLAEVGSVIGALTDAAIANGATHVNVHIAREIPTPRCRRMSTTKPTPTVHPLLRSVKPVVDALGASFVAADDMEASDVALVWEGRTVAGVRMPPLHGALDRLIDAVEAELGGRLPMLSREDKQRAVRLLDERGAFILRRAVEDVADAMGVSRITVYNYLNAIHR